MDIILVGCIVVSFIIGWVLGELSIVYRFKDVFIKELEQKTEKDPSDVSIYTLEQMNDNYFLYNKEGTFICQAKTMEELSEPLSKVTSIAGIVGPSDKLFWFENGCIKDVSHLAKSN
jgi:hypothetical protein